MNAPATNLISIRASSLGDLLDCPARWEAKHLLGMRMPSGSAAALGKAVHASTAVFDTARMNGSPVSAYDAAAAAVDAIHHPDEEVLWDEDLQPAAAEHIALALHSRYCAEIAPAQDYRAIEVQCDRLDITDLGISLTGTVDRVHATDEGLGITDLKTGKTAVAADGTVSTKGHAFQLGVYELLAQSASGLPITAPAQIVGMSTGKTAAAQRVGVAPVHDARGALLGDEHMPGVLQAAASIVRTGTFYGNPRSMLCNPKFCPRYQRCGFRK